MTTDIRPLTPELWPALDALFAAGGDPKWCYCQFWRKPGSNWTNTTAAQNRADLRALVDGVAVGWVGLGPREDFPRLARSRTLPQLPGEAVWVVNCFVVARARRRSGVAGRLLEAAVDYAKAHGAKIVEGYPVNLEGSRIPSASVYTGTATMFERAGFDVAAESTSKVASSAKRVVVRREA
jgi:GNAT superfamily N-acetyltransferase